MSLPCQDRKEYLETRCRGLIDTMRSEELLVVVDALASIDIQSARELEIVVSTIFNQALFEPHWCDTYADMVFALRSRYPEFPAPDSDTSGKPITFTRILLNACQNEFERLSIVLTPAPFEVEILPLGVKRRIDIAMANIHFIGELFLRQLVAAKVIGQIVHDLIGSAGQPFPEESKVECACELLQIVGSKLESSTRSCKKMMCEIIVRLHDFNKFRPKKSGSVIYTRRVRLRIQDILELTRNGWVKKPLKIVQLAQHGNVVRCTSLAGEHLAVIHGVKDAIGLRKALANVLKLDSSSFRALLPSGMSLREQEDYTPIHNLFLPTPP